MSDARVWECTNAEYHANREIVGSTGLKCILYSPQDFYQRFVATKDDGSPLIIQEPTKDLVIGNVTHCLALEPDKFDSLYAIEPEADGRTTKGKEIKAAFALQSIGKTIIKDKWYVHAKAMADSVLANPTVRELTEGAIIERAIVWTEDGIEQKCKPDWFVQLGGTDLHIDLKTAANPYPELWLSGGFANPMAAINTIFP